MRHLRHHTGDFFGEASTVSSMALVFYIRPNVVNDSVRATAFHLQDALKSFSGIAKKVLLKKPLAFFESGLRSENILGQTEFECAHIFGVFFRIVERLIRLGYPLKYLLVQLTNFGRSFLRKAVGVKGFREFVVGAMNLRRFCLSAEAENFKEILLLHV